MIAVYVIAGFLAAMVCITIFSVVRRSLRPARGGAYIPGGEGGANPAPRRVGLAQAIVDTFPIQKFSRENRAKKTLPNSDSELGIALPELPRTSTDAESSIQGSNSLAACSVMDPGSNRTSTLEATSTVSDDQCPICLVEFEVGDNLRVLPCEGQHRFHQSCVDPWLLRVSTSCPLCRKGEHGNGH